MSQSTILRRYVTVGEATYPPGTDVSKLDKDIAEQITAASVYEPIVDPDTSVGAGAYDGKAWTKAKLEAEVDKRNEGRSEEAEITVADPGNKPELVAALEQDDQNTPV